MSSSHRPMTVSEKQIASYFELKGHVSNGNQLFYYKRGTAQEAFVESKTHPTTAEDLFQLALAQRKYAAPANARTELLEHAIDNGFKEYTNKGAEYWIHRRFNEWMDDFDFLRDIKKSKQKLAEVLFTTSAKDQYAKIKYLNNATTAEEAEAAISKKIREVIGPHVLKTANIQEILEIVSPGFQEMMKKSLFEDAGNPSKINISAALFLDAALEGHAEAAKYIELDKTNPRIIRNRNKEVVGRMYLPKELQSSYQYRKVLQGLLQASKGSFYQVIEQTNVALLREGLKHTIIKLKASEDEKQKNALEHKEELEKEDAQAKHVFIESVKGALEMLDAEEGHLSSIAEAKEEGEADVIEEIQAMLFENSKEVSQEVVMSSSPVSSVSSKTVQRPTPIETLAPKVEERKVLSPISPQLDSPSVISYSFSGSEKGDASPSKNFTISPSADELDENISPHRSSLFSVSDLQVTFHEDVPNLQSVNQCR